MISLFSEKNFVFGEVALVMWMESNKEIFENVRDEELRTWNPWGIEFPSGFFVDLNLLRVLGDTICPLIQIRAWLSLNPLLCSCAVFWYFYLSLFNHCRLSWSGILLLSFYRIVIKYVLLIKKYMYITICIHFEDCLVTW